MNILRCYLFLPPLKGGMENHVKYLSLKQASQENYLVQVVYNQGSNIDNLTKQILPNINLRKIKPQILRDSIFYTALITRLQLRRVLKFDVIHIHGDWSAFIYGLLISKIFNIPIKVASIHGSLKNRGVWRYIYKYILDRYSFVYCTGISEVTYLQSLGLNNVYWQHSGVRDDFFDKLLIKSETEYDVISVGSLIPIKNFDLLLDVALLLPKYKFVIVGEGILKNALQQRCMTESIFNVTFVTQVSAKELSKIMDKSKVFLSTSLSEGTPTVLLEAMVKGLPSITTPSNDYSDLIVDDNGFIVKYDAKDIAYTLTKILEDKFLYDHITSYNLKNSKHFGWRNVARNISDLMEGYLNDHKKNRR